MRKTPISLATPLVSNGGEHVVLVAADCRTLMASPSYDAGYVKVEAQRRERPLRTHDLVCEGFGLVM